MGVGPVNIGRWAPAASRYRGAMSPGVTPLSAFPGLALGSSANVGDSNVRDIVVDGALVRVVGVGLACCALEVVEGMSALPATEVGGRPIAHVVVMGGTVSLGIKGELDRTWAATPEPKIAVAFGACTISGGPYWDSYAVLPGLRGEYGPAVEVPGCPPRPDVLRGAVETAARRLLTDLPAEECSEGEA